MADSDGMILIIRIFTSAIIITWAWFLLLNTETRDLMSWWLAGSLVLNTIVGFYCVCSFAKESIILEHPHVQIKLADRGYLYKANFVYPRFSDGNIQIKDILASNMKSLNMAT